MIRVGMEPTLGAGQGSVDDVCGHVDVSKHDLKLTGVCDCWSAEE